MCCTPETFTFVNVILYLNYTSIKSNTSKILPIKRNAIAPDIQVKISEKIEMDMLAISPIFGLVKDENQGAGFEVHV